MKYRIIITDTEGDSNSIFFEQDKKVVGAGFIPKEGKREGHICLTRCPECHRENYAMAVLSGVCAWCGWDANG